MGKVLSNAQQGFSVEVALSQTSFDCCSGNWAGRKAGPFFFHSSAFRAAAISARLRPNCRDNVAGFTPARIEDRIRLICARFNRDRIGSAIVVGDDCPVASGANSLRWSSSRSPRRRVNGEAA
jgi:hypothetical protein